MKQFESMTIGELKELTIQAQKINPIKTAQELMEDLK